MSGRRVTRDDPRIPKLIELYLTGLSIPQAARKLGLGCGTASRLLQDAGVEIRISKPWAPEKINRLIRLRQSGWSWSRISVDLDCSVEVARRVYRKHGGTDLPADTTAQVIARDLGRSLSSVYQQARALGLRRSAESDAETRRRIALSHPSMRRTQFKPGLRPWNKGRPFKSGGRSVETRFKPGTLAGAALARYQPIGSTAAELGVKPRGRFFPALEAIIEHKPDAGA